MSTNLIRSRTDFNELRSGGVIDVHDSASVEDGVNVVLEGEDRPMIERLRDDLGLHADIDLPGFVENPYALMARAAVFVLSSRWEGSPNALVEAMACGTPVVATDCPSGPAETLDGGRFGKLVPVGNAVDLGEAILETLDAPLAAEILRSKADNFTVERSAEQYLRVLLGKDAF